MISQQRIREMARYLSTGAVGASLNVGGAVFLTECAGLNYLVSLALSSAMVVVVGFFLNRSWTFRKSGRPVGTEFVRYALVTGVNVVIGLAACAVLVKFARIPYAYSIAIVAIAFAPITYVIHRGWTFGLSWLQGR